MSENKQREMEELKGVFDTLSESIPNLINKLVKSYYSPDNAANMAKSIGVFYKELVDAGIPEEKALKMAQDYMISFEKMSSSFKNKGGNE